MNAQTTPIGSVAPDFSLKSVGKDAAAVKIPCAANAIRAILDGKTPDPATSVAIGCGIKAKK